MNLYHNSGLPGNGNALPFSSLPLFDWAATRIVDPLPTMRAIEAIARRARLPIHIAAVFAVNNGLGGQAE